MWWLYENITANKNFMAAIRDGDDEFINDFIKNKAIQISSLPPDTLNEKWMAELQKYEDLPHISTHTATALSNMLLASVKEDTFPTFAPVISPILLKFEIYNQGAPLAESTLIQALQVASRENVLSRSTMAYMINDMKMGSKRTVYPSWIFPDNLWSALKNEVYVFSMNCVSNNSIETLRWLEALLESGANKEEEHKEFFNTLTYYKDKGIKRAM
jgi:hypothetical protein